MSSVNCHRCARLMAASLPMCPHCGAPQDAQSRGASATKQREILLAVLPAVVCTVAGWLLVGSEWGIGVGFAVGLAIGVCLVAVKHARDRKK